ncbi:MAG: hypothetical protein AAF721_20345 [Myxococcota bacterium]
MFDRLEKADLVAYKSRDWARARTEKERYWAEQARAQGVTAGLKASEALWIHARSVCENWPTAHDRRRDLEHHLAMSSAIERLQRVFSRP